MRRGDRGRISRGALPAAALALAGALCASPAAAMKSPPGAEGLSPRLAELAKPAVRALPPAEQAKVLSLAPSGPGSLLRSGNRVLVEVRFDRGAAAGVEDLRQAGAEVVNVSRRYQTVTVAAKPDELSALNGVPRMVGAREVLKPIIAESECPAGIAISEGVRQLHAGEESGEARNVFEVDGSGVTVGILSDSFNRATEAVGGGPIATDESQDVENGDLPGTTNTCRGQSTPVDVLDDTATEGEDEGRAMAQIVHDVAPGANLAFATAFTGETAFAENIEKLAEPGGPEAKVIADDVSYFEEPFFQEGPVGVAVSRVTREDEVSYFSAAGNNNLIHGGRDIASWEAPQFRDAGSCPSALTAFEALLRIPLHATHCMDFNPGSGTDTTFGITVEAGAVLTADIQWAEAWEGVSTDLDAFLIGPEGEVVAASGENNPAEGRPFELIGWENETGRSVTVQLVINRFSGANPRLKVALLQNGGGVTSTEYESSVGGDVVGPTIFGHNGGEDVTSVAAIRFSATNSPEPYSSRGPVTHYFGPVNGTTPASPLGTPEVLSKPDLTATDCGVTTFFAFEDLEERWRFCGTSAATPHAAAVAALMLQMEPGAKPGQIRTALTESADPIGTFGPCDVGAGLVDAPAAIQLLLTPEALSLEPCVSPASPPIEEGESRDNEVPTEFTPQSTLPPFQPNFTPPPSTFFLAHPAHVIRTRGKSAKVRFTFGPHLGGVAFLCKIDKGKFHGCPAKLVRKLKIGKHVLKVKAVSSAGLIDPTPVVFRFRVKHVG
jgi:Subtilase family